MVCLCKKASKCEGCLLDACHVDPPTWCATLRQAWLRSRSSEPCSADWSEQAHLPTVLACASYGAYKLGSPSARCVDPYSHNQNVVNGLYHWCVLYASLARHYVLVRSAIPLQWWTQHLHRLSQRGENISSGSPAACKTCKPWMAVRPRIYFGRTSRLLCAEVSFQKAGLLKRKGV